MRARKHAAPRPWRRSGMVRGVPLAPLFVDDIAVQPDSAWLTDDDRFARP
ncbi:hypothetical protein SAMN06272735_4477 [Streptomyces sp. TLI_55]|nr:hypothetical protein SAMN06272735_4477 [Streptomyces sp. TLI_55]